MQALTRVLNVGKLRARGYYSPTEWVTRERIIKYSGDGPDQPRRDNAKLAVWSNNIQPVAVLARTSGNTIPYIDNMGQGGVVAIPEQDHASACGCLLLTTSNPMEFTAFCTWCLPKDCCNELENQKFASDGDKETRKYVNTSLTYFSLVSEGGTVLPRLMQRTPLSSVARGKAKKYLPPGAAVNLVSKPTILKAVMAQVSRPEFMDKVARFTEDAEPETGGDLCRFPPLQKQIRCLDVKIRKGMSVDEIINNSVLTCPYYGAYICPYCCETIQTRDIQDIMQHLANRHKKLAVSWFTCPACISVVVTNWINFDKHWRTYHSSVLGLITVL